MVTSRPFATSTGFSELSAAPMIVLPRTNWWFYRASAGPQSRASVRPRSYGSASDPWLGQPRPYGLRPIWHAAQIDPVAGEPDPRRQVGSASFPPSCASRDSSPLALFSPPPHDDERQHDEEG